MARVHIIGAGVAGLAAAVRLSQTDAQISLYEAAPRAGGRCRSYHDPLLDRVIDNGNHLLLSGNYAVQDYLREIDAADRLIGPPGAAFPFVDVTTGQRWNVRPSQGVIPWWLFDRERRVPDTTLWNYLTVAQVVRSRADQTVSQCVGESGALYRRFWQPFTVGVLNTEPAEAAATLLRPVLLETFFKGAAACRPLIARTSLADSFIDPALAVLQQRGAEIRFGARVSEVTLANGRVTALRIDGASVTIAAEDVVVLAVPAWIAETLIPGLKAPPPGEPIVNIHYKLPRAISHEDDVRIVGIVGGTAQWVFARGDIASVTISAAAKEAERTAGDIEQACWPEVVTALGLADMPLPPARVIKERRATFAQTPAAVGLRPACVTATNNLLLAGDWTATRLPATLEGAIRSGFTAAAEATILLKRRLAVPQAA